MKKLLFFHYGNDCKFILTDSASRKAEKKERQ